MDDTKICSKCKIEYPKTEEYFYKQKTLLGYRLSSECKECAKKRSLNTYYDNWEEYRQYKNKWREENKESQTEYFSKRAKEKRELINKNVKNFYSNNPHKLKEYQEKRKLKRYNISDNEWNNCKKYFNFECAYCGISENEAISRDNKKLSKEHVYNDGPNELYNCIPACCRCNSEKHKKEFENWYNENNPKFSILRYNLIIKWLSEDSFKFLE